jgi:hypothetical protein
LIPKTSQAEASKLWAVADPAHQLVCYLAYPPSWQLPSQPLLMRQWADRTPRAERRHGPGALAGSRALRPAGQAWSRRELSRPRQSCQRIGTPTRRFLVGGLPTERTAGKLACRPARRNLLSCGVRGWMLGRQPRCRGRAPRGRLGVDLSPRKPEAREISDDLARPLPRPMGIGETRPPPVRPDLEVDSSSATQEGASRCWMRSTLNHQHSVVW